ncbi:hypothetical protein TCAL_04648 [Tigriopus californicus]|uniref:Lysosomal cobalamin transporter n=1 Tax=Tigriopus californicus TaxID=6832 RepID=A0A553NB62_TIGCA|nr:hypothetical protein TCAL_04648 [Tigriopus californicus]
MGVPKLDSFQQTILGSGMEKVEEVAKTKSTKTPSVIIAIADKKLRYGNDNKTGSSDMVTVWATGWIPFIVVFLLSLLFSTTYIMWFRSVLVNERSKSATFFSVLALTITLVSSALVPVDVFLVSYMKESNGTFKTWAQDESVRMGLERSMLFTYYGFYGIVLVMAFFLLPLVFFLNCGRSIGESDQPMEYEPFSTQLCRALKYELICLAIFAVLIVIGIFLPYKGPGPNPNSTYIQEMDRILTEEFEVQHGENLMVFLLNVLNVIGMFFLIFYTAYGMSSLPFGMIRSRSQANRARDTVNKTLQELEQKIQEIKSRYEDNNENMPPYEKSYLERLEQQVRLLSRTRHDLDQNARKFINRIHNCLRPFQVLFGVFFALLGLMIFISLVLTSVEKALYSQGIWQGYSLRNGSLPNPVDTILVYAQDIFPLDYIMYSGMILFFIFCSMSGIKNIGIRMCWFTVYKIKSGQTKPQALVLMCMSLIFVLLALNVVMFSVVPDYTTYGSQYYRVNNTIGNVTTEIMQRCNNIHSPADGCIMTRVAFLLMAYHTNIWFFGAIYYWMVWIFVVVIVAGACYSLYQARKPLVLEQDDEEELLEDSNPFAAA